MVKLFGFDSWPDYDILPKKGNAMLQICKYGNSILRVKAPPLDRIDRAVVTLAEQMIDLMLQRNGVGLAAQQVGRPLRIFVMHVPPQYDVAAAPGRADIASAPRLNPDVTTPLVVINPVLLDKQGGQVDKEGCLSIPEIFAPVHRAGEVLLSFLDLQGQKQKLKLRGLMARVVQHETDHLDGILFVDRISTLKKIALAAKLKRLKRASSLPCQSWP